MSIVIDLLERYLNLNQWRKVAEYLNANTISTTSAASTVTGPDTVGAAKAVGVLTTYAREDHDHGLPGDTTWTAVSSFSGTWGNGFTPAAFSKDGNIVSMRGQVSGGTINTAAFTLPAGYRPSQVLALGTTSNGAFGQITVDTSGTVTPVIGSTTNASLALSFSVL